MDINQQLIREPGFREDSYVYHKGDGFYYHFNYVRRSEMLAFRRGILNQARALTYVSFSEIIHEERRRITDRQIRSQLTYRRLRPAMQRVRSNIFPHVPSSLRELTAIHLDPAWAHVTRTSDNSDSIYLGSVDALDGSHSIIYCSQRNLQLLREVCIIFGDGTFYITPSIDNCYQVIPLLWCLMEKKTEAAYVSVFEFLRARLGHYNFDQAVCDFEDAMINAFNRVFDIHVHGCYFHYVNALGKWVRVNISHTTLLDIPEALDIVRYCCALPLLPRHLLRRGFEVILYEALEMGLYSYLVCFPFLNYVEVDWLNHPNRGSTLSVCGSPHRTNNASESNNKRMNRRLQRAHPNIFHLIHEFIQFEDETVDDVNSLIQGRIPTRHRTTQCISNDHFIMSLTSELMQEAVPNDDQLLMFLKLASFSVNNIIFSALGMDTT